MRVEVRPPHIAVRALVGDLTANPVGTSGLTARRTNGKGTPLKIFVAGASSVLGLPLIRACIKAGHEVIGLTRSEDKASLIAAAGAEAVVGDVADAAHMDTLMRRLAPDAVVSLLMTLPPGLPRRAEDFEPTQKLWAAVNYSLLPAAQAAAVQTFVAESMIFAYGYGRFGKRRLTEDDPNPGPPPLGEEGRPFLNDLRSMEELVLSSSQNSETKGIVLRYGLLHGAGVPHWEAMVEGVRRWAVPVPTGGALMSWVDVDDAASATVAAIERGRGGQRYNIVDDQPVQYRQYMNDLATIAHRPRPLPVPRWLMSRYAPYAALAFGFIQVGVSNEKAHRELGWMPKRPDHLAVFNADL